MSERLKRILFIAFIVVFTIGVGIGVYILFFRPEAPTGVVTPTETGEGGVLPPSGEAGEREGVPTPSGQAGFPSAQGGIGGAGAAGITTEPQTILLNDSITREASMAADGQGARFYDPSDSKFYRVNTDGLITELSSETFPNVESVSWGNSSDQAIMTFPDGTNIYYNFTTNKQSTLPKHWEDFEFSSDDRSVVAKSEAVAPEARFLIITDPDGTDSRAIEPLAENGRKTFPTWTANGQIIAYATVGTAMGFDRQEIILIGQNHENYTGLLVEGRGFTPLWSPSGQTIVYSVWNLASDYKPELWVSGGAPGNLNENRRQIGIQTWADKCAWRDETTLFCGVPNEMPRGAGLEPSVFTDLVDSIVMIDLENGVTSNLGSPEGDVSVSDPIVTTDGQYFIFTDTNTGKLYRFRIL